MQIGEVDTLKAFATVLAGAILAAFLIYAWDLTVTPVVRPLIQR